MTPEQTLPMLEKAIGLWEGLARAEPDRLDHLADLANAYNLVAVLHSHHGKMPDSLRALEASIELRERLAAAHPDDPESRNDLASGLNNLGALVQRNSHEDLDLLQLFRHSADHSRVAFARAPHVVRYGRFLAVTLRNIMVNENARDRVDEAVEAIREALEVSRRLARDNPALPALRRELVQDYRSLGDLLREHGRMAEAVRLYRVSWGPAEGVPRNGADDWYAAAILLSLCARPAVADGASIRDSERVECRRYGDAAMAALRRAIGAGFRNAEALRVCDEFAPLRDRGDFAPLLARAESAARGQPPPEDFARTPFPPPGFAADRVEPGTVSRPQGAGAGAHHGHDRNAAAEATAGNDGGVHLEEEQASSRHAFGLVQLELGRFEEARASLGRALAGREALVREHGGDSRLRADLWATRAAIGRLDWRAGRLAEASRAWDEVRRGLESDLRSRADEPTLEAQLAALEMTAGHSHAESALWEDAAAAFERAVRHGSRGRLTAIYRASALAVTDDRGGLKAVCRAMLDEYSTTSEASFANRLVRWCALVPGIVPDPDRLVALARKAVAAGQPDPLLKFHLALAAHRAGRFDEAIRWATQSLAAVPPSETGLLGAFDEAVLAMAHHRLGQTDAAARRLEAIARIDWEASVRRTEPQDWWQRADFLTLKREAIQTVTGEPAPDDIGLRRRRAQAYSQLGRLDRAEAESRAADASAARSLDRAIGEPPVQQPR